MENIEQITVELINDFKNNNLTKSSLRIYYKTILNNFNQVTNFKDYSTFRFSGSLFGLMLEIDDFEDDPDIRQSIASIGFYILSKGMEKFCLDENFNFKPNRSIEQIELISSRISLMLESNASIKFSLRLSKPNIDPYYTPLMDEFESESRDYSNMLLCDSYSLKYLCSKPENVLFKIESLKLANKVYEEFSNAANVLEKVENGRESQIRLYKYLKQRFENDKEYTFE